MPLSSIRPRCGREGFLRRFFAVVGSLAIVLVTMVSLPWTAPPADAATGDLNVPLGDTSVQISYVRTVESSDPITDIASDGYTYTSYPWEWGRTRACIRYSPGSQYYSTDMVYGSGVGEALVRHPAIRAVGFTGSLKGGRALCDLAAARPQPIPVFAEMSSINPLVVLPEALRRRGRQVAEELAASVTLGCGQFCTNPGLVIGIRSAQFSAFLERFAARMDDQPAQTMLNTGTLASYEKGLAALHAHPRVRHLAGQPQEGRQARPQLFQADVSLLLEGDELLQEEVFGPASVVVEVADHAELKRALHGLHGQLTATLIAEAEDLASFADLVPLLEQKAGRLLLNGYPTGVEVCDAMVHGGPYPATSDARGTSVGTLAIDRFLRPVCYQNYPDAWLPEALKDGNPLGIARLVDGVGTRAAID